MRNLIRELNGTLSIIFYIASGSVLSMTCFFMIIKPFLNPSCLVEIERKSVNDRSVPTLEISVDSYTSEI